MAVEAGGDELTGAGGDGADVREEVVGEACDCWGGGGFSLGLGGDSRGGRMQGSRRWITHYQSKPYRSPPRYTPTL